MTSPLQQALAAVQALADGDDTALGAVQTQLAQVQIDDNSKTQLLTAAQAQLATSQAQNAAFAVQVAALTAQVATLTAELAALQPKPASLGASLSANTTAEATRVGSALGVNSFRVYDGSKGPAALLTQITPLLNAGYKLAASFHLSQVTSKTAFTNGTASASVYAAINTLLTLPIVLIPEHEPDQKNRIPGPDWIAIVKKVRAMRDALGDKAQAELWLCLTGTSPSRAATWFPGSGVIDGIAFDNYSNSTDVQAVCAPFAAAVKALDPALQVGVFEYGPFSTATPAMTEAIVSSIDRSKLAALGITRFYWYDTTVAAGKQISTVADIASVFKTIATS